MWVLEAAFIGKQGIKVAARVEGWQEQGIQKGWRQAKATTGYFRGI